ncbi:MAG: hypothetical protein WCA95_11565 [Opitutaceae bacterium]
MEPAEIGNIGERYVEQWLTSKGYKCNRNTQLPGSTDIEAHGSPTSLLVQVKTAVSPNVPAVLTADENKNITARAAKLGWQPWLARVTIDAKNQLVGEILWLQLS